MSSASLRCVHLLPSFGIGGQERVALDLAACQLGAGCIVTAVALADGGEGPMAREFRAAGVAVATVAKGRGVDPTLPLRLALFLRRRRVELVHAHNPQPLIYGALAARLAGARLVYTRHGANLDLPRRRLLRRGAARLVDAYVAVSQATAERALADREPPRGKLLVIDNGIDLRRFHPDGEARAAIRAELAIPEGAWVVTTVGRLVPSKAQARLIRALAPLLDGDHRLIVAGDGPEAGALRRLVGELPGGRFVHLLGERRDVPRLLAAGDVFALPSDTEGLPLVIPEAMATGLAVVASAVGGIGGVLDEGRTGWLLPPGDEGRLRERLAALAADRAGAAAVGAQARDEALARYSAERMAAAYLALYRRLLAGLPPTGNDAIRPP